MQLEPFGPVLCSRYRARTETAQAFVATATASEPSNRERVDTPEHGRGQKSAHRRNAGLKPVHNHWRFVREFPPQQRPG